MIKLIHHPYTRAFLLGGSALAFGLLNVGCSSAHDAVAGVQGALSGCDEFNGGATSIAALSIDGDAKAFVTASANLVAVTQTAETAVLDACIGMATDLHIPDTWTAKAPSAGAAPDDETAEVCTQVSNAITATLNANASAMCTLVISGGHCVVDEKQQVSCESTCTGMTTCQPGDITTLCTPASLTGECDGTCNAMATCEGSASAQAQCQGACEGDCTGMCDADPCMATHCTGACAGKCTGDCKLAAAAAVNCGTSVNCRGGCSVTYKAPECETTVTPPVCKVSEACQSSCKSNTEVTSKCTPPGVELECNATASVTVSTAAVVDDAGTPDGALEASLVSLDATVETLDASDASFDASGASFDASGAVVVSADLQTLIDTVRKNMPSLVLLVKTQSQLFLDATSEVETTGKVVVNNVSSLGGKDVACAGTAVTADVSASASMNVSVKASSKVSGSCGGPTSS